MQLSRLRAGDTVKCNVRGREFQARVVEVGRGEVRIDPPPGYTYVFLRPQHITKRVHRPKAGPWASQITQEG